MSRALTARRTAVCAYCGTRRATERDHVPPKTLFPKPRPANLITVPACKRCHSAFALHDEYFKTMLALRREAAEHHQGSKLLLGVLRGLKRTKGQALGAAIFSGMRNVEVRSKAGLYLGRQPAFLVSTRRILAAITQRLAKAYAERKLYNTLYRVGYREERELADPDSTRLWSSVYPRLRDPKERAKLEQEIEGYAGLEPGSVAVYCPDRKMNLKRYEVLVQARPESDVKPLKAILDNTRKEEMNVLSDRFKNSRFTVMPVRSTAQATMSAKAAFANFSGIRVRGGVVFSG